ncbi:hypothetical protein J1614_012097 [Plenodomus biglobosus]|nr:hypothetical protein J1614_012097 [Plenodomus biglobosus]
MLNPEPYQDSTELFTSLYDDETSRGFSALIEYCGGTHVCDLEGRPEKASAWLDDRTHASSPPPDSLEHSDPNIGLAQRAVQEVTRRYHPGFRSYLEPLTAAMLYKHRKEEVKAYSHFMYAISWMLWS